MTRRVLHIVICLLAGLNSSFGQNTGFNTNPEKGFITINLPKTPESQAFEKYGNTHVNELTGTPEISIPLYVLQGKLLTTPVTLSYTGSSGIRVNQEAGWAGLGFDIITGGRITVDIKGNADGVSHWLTPDYQLGVQKIFERLGRTNPRTILTFATTQLDWGYNSVSPFDPNYPLLDDAKTVSTMAWYGAGEPDIYHASFGGQSVSYYFDMVTDSIKFLGEKSFCSITPVRNSNHTTILQWIITDAAGITYYFTPTEESKFSQPGNYGIFSGDNSTTAWLLNKIIHPAGDSVLFTYTKYGPTYPAFNWSASVAGRQDGSPATDVSNDALQNEFTLYPASLTRIETNNTAVDFILSGRSDLRGPGAKKLDEIRITDKQTNEVKRKVQFRYSYFTSYGQSPYTAQLPDSLKICAQLRLRLDSVFIADSATSIPPYRFHYFTASGPDKYSFSQDHWGFYNGTNNTMGYTGYGGPVSPKNLIPKQADLIAEKILPPSVVSGVTPPADGYALSRQCDTFSLKAMTLDTIIYPTGGKTALTMEAHRSNYISPSATITGGGLRVKRVADINPDGSVALVADYTYSGGVYQGAINYLTLPLSIVPLATAEINYPLITSMSNNGLANEGDFLVGYAQVKKTYKYDLDQGTTGSVIKYFNVPQPYQLAVSTSIEPRAAVFPVKTLNPLGTGDSVLVNNAGGLLYLNPNFYGLAPTPLKQLDGKMTKEEYYDNNNQLIKSVQYYYSQKEYAEKLYSIKVKENYSGGAALGESAESSVSPQKTYRTMEFNGVRRFTMAVSPAKSFYTRLDSTIEKTYQGLDPLIRKKTYQYNQDYQQEGEIIDNSDGTQTITKTLTSLALGKMQQGNAGNPETNDLLSLRAAHIYDLPVEQTLIRRNTAGDSLVLGSKLYVYAYSLPKKSYSMESATPPVYRSEFTPLSLSTPNANNGYTTTLQMDSRYKPEDTAGYTPSNLLQDISSTAGNRSYVWDEYHNNILAQALNAASKDIAYTSFENSAYGNWSLVPAAITTDNTSPSGSKVYSLTSGSISRNNLDAEKEYVVSYWSNTSSQFVNGTGGTAGPALNGWTCYEHIINNPAAGNITVSGSGTIDELRLFPKDALMNTFTYSPVYGLISQCDANNHFVYYEYDEALRVIRIRDEKRNILKQFEYKYNNQLSFPYGNVTKVSNAVKNNCPPGYTGTVSYPYTVPANKYGSFISQADADAKAQADADQNGQLYANLNGTCTPAFSFTPAGSWYIPSNSFTLSGSNGVSFSIVIAGTYPSVYNSQLATITGALYLPTADRQVSCSSMGKTFLIKFTPSGQVFITGPSFSGSVALSGSYQR